MPLPSVFIYFLFFDEESPHNLELAKQSLFHYFFRRLLQLKILHHLNPHQLQSLPHPWNNFNLEHITPHQSSYQYPRCILSPAVPTPNFSEIYSNLKASFLILPLVHPNISISTTYSSYEQIIF